MNLPMSFLTLISVLFSVRTFGTLAVSGFENSPEQEVDHIGSPHLSLSFEGQANLGSRSPEQLSTHKTGRSQGKW